jgi:hypothetical protein
MYAEVRSGACGPTRLIRHGIRPALATFPDPDSPLRVGTEESTYRCSIELRIEGDTV